ncbi:MAG: hypothetical protein DI589_13960 [Shinella sp.]|nr:MAG: hypothetical protein DI589_13960 [Shinella sp.]
MFFGRHKEAVRPAGHSARLFSFTIAFACLLFFFSAPCGQTAERTSSGQPVSPRIFLLNPEITAGNLLKAECRKLHQPTKIHAARPSAQVDFLPPPAMVLLAPFTRRGASPPIEGAASQRPKVEKLDARGPPA